LCFIELQLFVPTVRVFYMLLSCTYVLGAKVHLVTLTCRYDNVNAMLYTSDDTFASTRTSL